MTGAPLTGLATLLPGICSMPESSSLPARRGRRLWLQPCFSLGSGPAYRRDSAARGVLAAGSSLPHLLRASNRQCHLKQ